MENRNRKTSFFWPVILVGAGAILLLRNFGILQEFNFNVLFRLWPLILVVIGLDLIFGRRFPWAGALIGLLTIGAAILFLYYAPTMGINESAGVKSEVLSTPLENTEHVEYYLDTSSEHVSISALPESDDLFNATIVHRGQLNFDVRGDTDKTISLSETTEPDDWFNFDIGQYDLKWDLRLASGVPSAITLDGGSGSLDIDLTGITLESMRASLGSGSSNIDLPASATSYPVTIESGSGSVRVMLPGETGLTLTLSSGSGSVTMRVPVDAAVKVEVLDGGSGSLRLPADLLLVKGSGDFEYDTWQTSGFDSAANQIVIRIVDRGSGSITLNH
jgi:hypothetical protein